MEPKKSSGEGVDRVRGGGTKRDLLEKKKRELQEEMKKRQGVKVTYALGAYFMAEEWLKEAGGIWEI